MANTNYTVLLQTQVNANQVQAQIQSTLTNLVFKLKLDVDPSSWGKLNDAIDAIKTKLGEVQKIDYIGDEKTNKVNKALITWKDAYGNINKTSVSVDKTVASTTKWTNDIAKAEKEVVKTEQQKLALLTKEKDQMAAMKLQADQFLERSKKMKASPELAAGIEKAQAINEAVSAGEYENAAKLSGELKVIDSGLRMNTSSASSFNEQLKSAVMRSIQWATATGLVYGAMQQFQQGLQYVIEFNKEMTNLQLITGKSSEQISFLATEYNKMAMDLGSTTLEVAKASETWMRQGKSAQDAAILTEASIKMSKLAMTDTATASENLTAIMNGFQLSAKDTTGVMDKLLAVSNSTKTSAAVSFNEISTAMSKSATTAMQAGISFDELESYIKN